MIAKLLLTQASCTAICDYDLGRLYRTLFLKTFGIKLQRPSRGEHITIIREYSYVIPLTYVNLMNRCMIQFDLTTEHIYTNGNAFWFDCMSNDIDDIYQSLCLTPVSNPHFCIGYLNESNTYME